MNISMPIGPRLVTVNVPPCMLGGRERAAAGTIDQVARPGGELAQRQPGNVANHRDQQAAIGVDGDADVDRSARRRSCRRPSGRSGAGAVPEASAVSLTTMSVKPIAGASLGAGDGLELLAQVDQVGGVDGRRERDGGGRSVHFWTMRSAIVRRIGRDGNSGDLVTRLERSGEPAPAAWRPPRTSRSTDAAARAAASQSGRVDAQLARHAPGARRDARLRFAERRV